MNSLNVSASDVRRAPPPLVWQGKSGVVVWVEHGIGHVKLRGSRRWVPIADVEVELSGRVLTSSEVVALVAEFGRPT